MAATSSRASPFFQRLREGPMKRLYEYYTPQAVNFAGGVPMDSIFPVRGMRLDISHSSPVSLSVDNKDLHLNYLRGDGLPALKSWVLQHMKQLHSAPSSVDPFGVCLTVGSTDSFSKCLTMLNGDTVLFDEYAYGSAVATARTHGRTNVGVRMDAAGMVPADLKHQIRLARDRGLDPDIVYLVPTAQNPTGVTMTSRRKEEIYRVCQDECMLVVEDDAYYYLYHGVQNIQKVNEVLQRSKSDPADMAAFIESLPGLKSLPPSLLSMDTEGRVIRFDSLSKFICPGFRIGWISNQDPTFIEKYKLMQEISTQFPSGVSQSVFLAITGAWGDDKLHTHLQQTQAHYCLQRNAMCDALSKSFSPAQCKFEVPDGGMFLWLRFKSQKDVPGEAVFKVLAKHDVIVVPGDDFKVPGVSSSVSSPSESCNGEVVLRLSYAASSPELIEAGVARMAEGIKEALRS